MNDHSFRCGDIVLCISEYYTQQLNIAGKQGIVMGAKPHHIHLWYEELKRSFWLTYDILKLLEDPETSPLLSRIRTLVYSLNAEEWELEEGKDQTKLICYLDQVSFETLYDLRNYLDIDYRSLSLYPEGMGRMIAEVVWENDER